MNAKDIKNVTVKTGTATFFNYISTMQIKLNFLDCNGSYTIFFLIINFTLVNKMVKQFV